MTPDDQRAPDGEAQFTALANAEAAGVLPETDRRIPSAQEYLDAGYAIRKDATGYHVTTPDGEQSHGATVHDAVLNIGAVFTTDPETRARMLERRDGSIVPLSLL